MTTRLSTRLFLRLRPEASCSTLPSDILGRAREACRTLASSSGQFAFYGSYDHRLSSRKLHPLIQEQHLNAPMFGLWGANTDVGKTLVSAGLAASVARRKGSLLYLKPVQTGFPEDCDARLVCATASGKEEVGPHAAELLPPTHVPVGATGGRGTGVVGKTLFAWRKAVGPHLAVDLEGRAVADDTVLHAIRAEAASFCQQPRPSGSEALVVVETAGGVASPSPSGSLQCDLLRPLRLPAILVGDSRLGGISATIAALETLQLRGIDTAAVVMIGGQLQNGDAISRYLQGRVPVFSLPACNRPDTSLSGTRAQPDENLLAWLEEARPQLDDILSKIFEHHLARVARLSGMAEDARKTLWWPFTQHANISNDLVTILDSRCGDDFAVYCPAKDGDAAQTGRIEAQYDACASWWTQGMGADLQALMAREIGYAAGRYSHLMYPENAHEPALALARKLLDGPGNGWASRVFYSDNGSTALEVGVKMAFRKYIMENEPPTSANEEPGDGTDPDNLHIVGLTESYHGDTLGCMDLSGPSPFNGRMQTPWYEPRGLFLDPPTVGMSNGLWKISLPSHYALDGDEYETEFETLDEVFASHLRAPHELTSVYQYRINASLDRHPNKLAVCVMEPVLQGAGGMRMIDPVWQLLVANTCRARGLPIVLDEVFTGLWRLGRVSAAEMLGFQPDVACYAKLLTGGTVPLAATIATEEVFRVFDGPSKVESLLHGHSYSAHPIGCHAGFIAMSSYADAARNPNYLPPDVSHASGSSQGSLMAMWDEGLVRDISFSPKVKRVLAIGTVFAAELVQERGAGSGYLSSAARKVTECLRHDGVFARPLGNVVYLMASPFSSRERCRELLEKVMLYLK